MSCTYILKTNVRKFGAYFVPSHNPTSQRGYNDDALILESSPLTSQARPACGCHNTSDMPSIINGLVAQW